MHLPVMTDPEMRAFIELWERMMPPAYFLSPTLLGIVGLKQVNISLHHGNSPTSSHGYITYGMFLVSGFGQYEEGYAYGRLALELNRRFEHTELVCKLNAMFAAFLLFYKRPLRETFAHLDRAYHAGLSIGDFGYLSYTTMVLIFTR